MEKRNWKSITNGIKKAIVALGIGTAIAGMVAIPSYAANETIDNLKIVPLDKNQYGGIEITDGGSNTGLKKYGASFATKYDPRITGKVSSKIENQGSTQACWAFSSIAAIESNLIKKGYENESVDLSENHLAYFFYNRTTDPLGYTKGDLNKNIGNTWWNNGGTLQGTALSLMTWSGVVKETQSEDDANGNYAPQSLSANACYNSDYRVANTYFFNYSVNTVKQAIMDYGAVATGMWMYWDNYENETYDAYYCPVDPYAKDYNVTSIYEGGHAVTIVGWDDSFSKTYFSSTYMGKKCQPENDGAWIVKNSYGSSIGDGGYIYISYEDASLTELVAFDMATTSQSYDNNYQYDGSANPAAYLTYPSGTQYANVFKAKGSASGYNETLKAVSVDVYATNVKYSLQIYTGVTSTSKPTSGKAMFSTPQTGTLTNAGYNQITLKTPVTLTAGEKYAVVIALSTSSGISPHLACESSYSYGWIFFEANTDAGQGYVYYDKKWLDAGSVCNLRIKAYTDNTTQKTTYKLSSNNLGISKGSSTTLSLKVTPSSVKRKITWTSSNKKVATVSSNGKVKAKAYGTTTIKAKFVAGSKTKTLSCKVTVGPSKLKSYKVSAGKGKVTVRWKKNSAADGYEIYYSTKENSGFKKLTTAKKSKSKVTKKLKSGTYYVKMRAYKSQGKKKLYGSYTATKKVTVR